MKPHVAYRAAIAIVFYFYLLDALEPIPGGGFWAWFHVLVSVVTIPVLWLATWTYSTPPKEKKTPDVIP